MSAFLIYPLQKYINRYGNWRIKSNSFLFNQILAFRHITDSLILKIDRNEVFLYPLNNLFLLIGNPRLNFIA